jgi:hypothetical protein
MKAIKILGHTFLLREPENVRDIGEVEPTFIYCGTSYCAGCGLTDGEHTMGCHYRPRGS